MDVLEEQFKLLSPRDLKLVAKLSERIHYTNPHEPFLNHAFVVLNEALPCLFLSVESYSINPFRFERAVHEGVSKQLDVIHRTYFHQHPLIKTFTSTEGKTCVSTILTETSREEFHSTDLYQKFYRVLGVEDQLLFYLPHPSGLYVIAYSRDTAFSEKEKVIMQLLRPQLLIALKNWQRICELEQYQRILMENSGSGQQSPMPLSEGKKKLAGLTRKQKLVAELVAQGLENREIAEVLHISPKTVGKHLENIFGMLNIHHRSALAAMWRQFNFAE